ncbi:MAG TPA: diguanylate cyclase, partial [Candidatus Limiplasma sp.]|nr:diguanylate cyclase [Candidatus Limiplasma sp.]
NKRLTTDRFDFLYGSSSVGLIITDTAGVIISFNKTIQDLFGITIDEYKNTNVADIYADPKDRRHLMDMLAKSSTVRDFEVQIKQKDGQLRSVLANIDYVEWNHEHVLLTSICDISQFKQRHNGTDSRYQELFSTVPVGITVTDYAGHILLSNNAIKELLGYNADELKDMSVRDFYYALSDRQELLALTRKLGNVRNFETCLRHKNGSEVTVLINMDTIEFNGRKDMLLTSIRDISHLKKVKDELVKERDFSNAILNTAATLIVVLDRTGVITRFNRACEQISGYSFDEINGTHLWETEFFDPVITQTQIDKLLSEAYPSIYESNIVSKTGEKHFVSWTFAAMRNSDDHVEYIIATGIDISQRKKAEDELQKANVTLASQIKELQGRTEEMNQLNELGELLQSCQTTAEASAISARYIKQLCPDSHGALYLINSSRNLAEAAEMWGEPALTQQVFEPLNCWAIRRGRQHLIDRQHPGLLCGHITGPETGQYLCVPLTVNGEAIGVLHMNSIPTDEQEAAGVAYTDHKTQLVRMIAEHIALALSNLKLRETLRQQSIRDALTGLYNRRYMEETLERELIRAQRENKSVGFIMFDIDHFKTFNDLAGHDGGDALLRELGVYLNTYTRGGDIVCRYGGEEFLAVLPGANAEEARQRAEQMRKDVSEMLVYHLGKALAKCTISLGVSAYPDNGQTSKVLLKAADDALYRAKNEGRNRVVVA